MEKARKSRFWIFAAVLFVFLMTLGTVLSVSAADNKSLKVANASFSDKTQRNAFKGAEASATFLKNDKLKKSGMTFSATVYIPVKALKKTGDQVFVDCYLYLQKAKSANANKRTGPSEEWEGYLGFVETKFDIAVQYNGSSLPKLMKRSWATGKFSSAGKYAAIRKSGAYYILTLKNMPFSSNYYDADDVEKPMVTTKNYMISPSVLIISDTAKAWKGNLYFDNLKVKSATKTQTITFNSKDYRGLYASNWASGTVKASITKPMK